MLATNSTSVLNATSAITPLSFLHVDPTRRRRRLQAAHKRRLNLAGLELEGNLNTLGCDIRYNLAHLLPNRPHASTIADESIACVPCAPRSYFSAEVCVGSPPKQFDLIIDTGSALTAFPCSDCPHCGTHQHAKAAGSRFDVSQSSSSQRVECARPPPGMHCRSCDNAMCSYGVSYTEGSSIRGRLVSDLFHFGSEIGPRQVRATFGCQTYESGLFYSQVADGISGFSQADTYGPTLFDYMRQGTGAPDVFSMCLSESVGALVLGGAVPNSVPLCKELPKAAACCYAKPRAFKLIGKQLRHRYPQRSIASMRLSSPTCPLHSHR